jgi:eukaryotic-like serine/threonine-protein kinase
LNWFRSHKQASVAEFLVAISNSYRGRFGEGQHFAQKAKTNKSGDEPDYDVRDFALQEVEAGDAPAAKRILKVTGHASRNLYDQLEFALIEARLGNVDEAQELSEQINEKAPQDTLAQHYSRPCIRAAIKLSEHDPAGAVEVLQPAEKYELVSVYGFNEVYPAYLRGLAFLQLGDGRRAASEFQKLIDHPAIVGRSELGPLALLQLGRAQAMIGDRVGARKSYQDFLDIWKDADLKLPALIQARAEFTALH